MKHVISLLLVVGVLAAAAGDCPAIERTATVIGSRVQMHESAAGDSPTVGLLAEGVSVTVRGRKPAPDRVEGFTDYWYRVDYRGRAGWVFGQFISPSSGGRGLARIYTAAEMLDYVDRVSDNLVAVRKAGYYAALLDGAARLSADIEEISADPILSPFSGDLAPYRLLAACWMAEGYAGTGNTGGAEKIRKQLLSYNPGTSLPDGTTLGARLKELDGPMRGPAGEDTAP
jgi:hypothetical protein